MNNEINAAVEFINNQQENSSQFTPEYRNAMRRAHAAMTEMQQYA